LRSPKLTDVEAKARVFRASLEETFAQLNAMVARRHEFHARMSERLGLTPTSQGTLMRNQDLVAAKAKLEKAQGELRRLTYKVQVACPHPHLREVSHADSAWGFPWRVCVVCGFAERGWYVGHQILSDSDRNGTRRIIEVSSSAESWPLVEGGRVHDNGDTMDVLRDRQPPTILWPDAEDDALTILREVHVV